MATWSKLDTKNRDNHETQHQFVVAQYRFQQMQTWNCVDDGTMYRKVVGWNSIWLLFKMIDRWKTIHTVPHWIHHISAFTIRDHNSLPRIVSANTHTHIHTQTDRYEKYAKVVGSKSALRFSICQSVWKYRLFNVRVHVRFKGSEVRHETLWLLPFTKTRDCLIQYTCFGQERHSSFYSNTRVLEKPLLSFELIVWKWCIPREQNSPPLATEILKQLISGTEVQIDLWPMIKNVPIIDENRRTFKNNHYRLMLKITF